MFMFTILTAALATFGMTFVGVCGQECFAQMVVYNNRNLALRKTATQSSILIEADHKGPGAAVDGRTDGDWKKQSCAHTNAEDNPWWQVDLEKNCYVQRVIIFNREDCCSERLKNVKIHVSTTENGKEFECGTFFGPAVKGMQLIMQCPHNTYGRFVRVMIEETNASLTLCEVEVYGYCD